jgi:hypothetical protein
MADPEVVFVKGTAGREEVRERAQRAIRALDAAQREFAESQAALDRTFGPDPRALVADQAVQGFVEQITGRPSIASA